MNRKLCNAAFSFCLAFLLCRGHSAWGQQSDKAIPMEGGLYSFPAGGIVGDFYVSEGLQFPDAKSNKIREDVAQVNDGIAWYFVNDISFGVLLTGAYADQPGPDAYGIGGNLQFRGHFLDEQKWTMFWDLEMGLMNFSRHVPPKGTDFNYVVHTGIGATIRVTPRVDLVGGVRYLHVSNANVNGSARNPSINGPEGYLGLLYRF
jgi:hypothetical protein